jgi:hypothetical protein
MLTKNSLNGINFLYKKVNIKNYLQNPLIEKLYHSLNTSYKIVDLKNSNSSKNFPNSNFIHKSLYQKIQTRNKKYKFQWKVISKYKIDITLHLYLNDNEKLPDMNLLIDSISYISSHTDCDRKIIINLCFLNDKKIIRQNQKTITPLNVNSGMNSFSHTDSEISIFRKEECIKVLMHEIIHSLRLSNIGTNEKITEKLCQKYKYQSSDILIDESYTEIWAKLMNIYFISKISQTEKKYQNFCTMLAIECEFSIYQGNKVKQFIKKNKITNVDDHTNVSAYYIIVGEIFTHFDEFLQQFMNPYLKDNKSFLKFIYNLETIKKKNISVKDKFYKTMKMSIIELQI